MQLLAQVLEQLGQDHVLQSCALVSSSWSTAAVLSVPEIDASLSNRGSARSLSRWLQAHAAAARISSITAIAGRPRVLRLPVQQLSTLQRLHLSNVGVSTHDYVGPSLWGLDALPALTSLALSNFSMPLVGLPALTGLQWLKLDSSEEPLQVALLSTLTALTSLQAFCPVMAGPDEPTLVVLTALTRLKHLEMDRFDLGDTPAREPADFAALTSSPALEHLDLHQAVIWDAAATVTAALFPDNRQLLNLRSLVIEMCWLEDLEAAKRVATCCPGLQHIQVNCIEEEPISFESATAVAAGLSCLTALSALTSLTMCNLDMCMDDCVFCCCGSADRHQGCCAA